MSVRNLLVTGGIVHTFETAAPALADVLRAHDIESTITEDIEEGLAGLARGEFDLLTLYALRFSMRDDRYAPHRARWAYSPSAAAREAIEGHLRAGRGLFGVHTASICFDDWPRWQGILGGAWQWGRSGHPPVGQVDVRIVEPDHVLVRGLPDFALVDEVYGDLALEPDVVPLMRASAAGADRGTHPMLWARNVGHGRVVYDALGHDAASMRHPVHARILARGAVWALGRPDAEVAAA
jgi:type 1 glutamine amidotransferase